MSVIVSSTEHMLAKAAQDVVAAAKFVSHSVLPALQRTAASEQTIEAITSLVDPQAVNIERAAFALLGLAIKTIEDSGTVANAGGMNVSLDALLVSDLRSIMPAIKNVAPKVATA